jgi:hypothetical protein
MSHKKELSLPGYDVVRARIEAVHERDIRYCLQTAYLYAGRISEVVGKASLGDSKTTARGPKGSDAVLDSYQFRDSQEPIVVFTVRTAKRDGIERKVAVPFNYEPWAKELYSYFQEFGNKFVFPFTRQKVWTRSKEVFQGLDYPVEEYRVLHNGTLQTVPRHARPFRLHALRHLRASELVSYYGFDGFSLATYGGWKYSTMARTSSVMDRYLSLSWQSYIEKLFKERR